MHKEESHIHTRFGQRCAPGDLGAYVVLPVDPDRAPAIASGWADLRDFGRHYEFRLLAGVTADADGAPVNVGTCSTGNGGTSAAITMDELTGLGVKTVVAVGCVDALPEAGLGAHEIVLAHGAVRLDGASETYVDLGYPAAADPEALLAARTAAARLGVGVREGLVASTQTWAGGDAGLASACHPSWQGGIQADLRRPAVLGADGETAVVYTLAGLYGVRAVSFLVQAQMVADQGWEPVERLALETVKLLAAWDRAAQKPGQKRIPAVDLPMHPSLGKA